MSGRLVILPHKSWNVWNQDNREKVARDERLHREKNESIEAKQKELLQEQNLQQLISRTTEEHSNSTVAINESNNALEPFRLFGDIESMQKKREEEEALTRIRDEKQQLEKKRDGTAPWALGEGAAEKKGGPKLWYLQPSASRSKAEMEALPSTSTYRPASSAITSASDISYELQAAKERELARKLEADPMNGILKFNRSDIPGAAVDTGSTTTRSGNISNSTSSSSSFKSTASTSASASALGFGRSALPYTLSSSSSSRAILALDGGALLAQYDTHKSITSDATDISTESYEKHNSDSAKNKDSSASRRKKKRKEIERSGKSDDSINIKRDKKESKRRRGEDERKRDKADKAHKKESHHEQKKLKRRRSRSASSRSSLSGDDGSDRGGKHHRQPGSDKSRGNSGSHRHRDYKANDSLLDSHNDDSRRDDNGRRIKTEILMAASAASATVAALGNGDNSDNLLALRRRRLERELVERRRAALILAKADIFGTQSVIGPYSAGAATVTGNRYNQQYNPQAALR
jgi:hypothetical protein